MSCNLRLACQSKGGTANAFSWTRTLVLFVGVGVAISGCRAFSAAPVECTPPPEVVPVAESAPDPETLAGSYLLTLVATEGRLEGHRADDLLLRLTLQRPELRPFSGPGGRPVAGTTQPLIGTLEGDVSGVGAVVPGNLTSEDPNAPGIALFVVRDAGSDHPQLTLRLGSEANRRDRIAFDAAFTVLRVSTLEDDGFRGEWFSGSGGATGQASGYFCAESVDEL